MRPLTLAREVHLLRRIARAARRHTREAGYCYFCTLNVSGKPHDASCPVGAYELRVAVAQSKLRRGVA